ncbi:MAG TPA: glycosyl transferase family 2 [Opitutaceae bacterium]|nr:glycosyl transferase family 2 [Opitutaceae bacterium]
MSPLRPVGHSLGLGRLVYLVWYRPCAAAVRCWREGGPVNQWITRRGQREMMRAARLLPPLGAPPADAPEVAFLTGRRFWYQTAFCFWSMSRQAGRPLRAAFHDDGTFDGPLRAECTRLFPGCTILGAGEIETLLDRHLPASRFPTLRARRLIYPNLRKLTDVHAGGRGWRLVLDSDMLFFRRPDLLLAWLDAPDRPLHMTDVQDAYGYSAELMSALAGGPIPHRLNVGLCGLRSDELDWDRLESWCRRLQAAEGTSYYQEQALVALLLAGRDCTVAPAADYRLMPSDGEARHPTAVLHHYVDLSKRGYFRHAWRHVAP